MTTQFEIQSNDPAQLAKATQIAETFAQPYIRDEIVGIVFLGAIVRGYFDRHADIDIALFAADGAKIPPPPFYSHIDGFEIQCFWSEYGAAVKESWDMAKRWAYTLHRIYYDPHGLVARLLADKIPLKPEEKRWLLMSGMAQSDWYINGLTQLWIDRGNLTSAHDMVSFGLDHFFQALFALNDELVPANKWRYYCVEQLPLLPTHFRERIKQVLLLEALSVQEIERRKQAFMPLWQEVLPLVERELQMTYKEFSQLV